MNLSREVSQLSNCLPDLPARLPACVCATLQVVGLYRLCGSAAVKKELREAFERDSHGVELCENTYPDVNVITGKPIARRRNATRLLFHYFS